MYIHNLRQQMPALQKSAKVHLDGYVNRVIQTLEAYKSYCSINSMEYHLGMILENPDLTRHDQPRLFWSYHKVRKRIVDSSLSPLTWQNVRNPNILPLVLFCCLIGENQKQILYRHGREVYDDKGRSPKGTRVEFALPYSLACHETKASTAVDDKGVQENLLERGLANLRDLRRNGHRITKNFGSSCAVNQMKEASDYFRLFVLKETSGQDIAQRELDYAYNLLRRATTFSTIELRGELSDLCQKFDGLAKRHRLDFSEKFVGLMLMLHPPTKT